MAQDGGPEVTYQQQCETNYFRLVQLTIIEGTKVVRKTVLNRLRQKKTLHTILSERRSEYLQKGSGFNKQQLEILYPPSGNADLSRIDMTLWFALARKLHVLPKSYMEDLRSESDPLLGTQVEWCHDLATIHIVRNNLFHLEKPEMDSEVFDDQWNRVTEALVRLDPSLNPEVDFERYRKAELNRTLAREFQLILKEQYLQEQCEDLVEEVHRKHRIIQMILLIVTLLLLLVLAGILVFFFLFRSPRACDKSIQYRVVDTAGALYFLPRSGWGAELPLSPLDELKMPTPYVVYTHTAEISKCTITEECCNQVKNIQYFHMKMRSFDDIGFHYLIDSSGVIFEGRNITKVPAAVQGWNNITTSVAFIGNFMYQTPNEEMIGAFDMLLAYLRLNNWIDPNYVIYGMCECRPTLSPGIILYDLISKSQLPYIRRHVGHRPEGNCTFNWTYTILDHGSNIHV